MTEDQQQWYESGLLHGIEMGRQQLQSEYQETHAAVVAIIRRLGKPVDELATKRGEHARASRHRELMAARGIKAVTA